MHNKQKMKLFAILFCIIFFGGFIIKDGSAFSILSERKTLFNSKYSRTMSVCFLTRTENSPVRADGWCNNLDMGSSNMTDNNGKNIIDPFEAWVKMRTGVRLDSSREDEGIAELGTSPIVFWAGYGELRESYSGKVIAKFEGFDVAKGVRLDNDTVRQLSRKIFWWRDAKTGKLLTDYKGSQVDPIRYDYQTFDYSRYPSNNETNIIGNGCGVAAYPTVVNGIRDVFADPITFQMIGESCLFQASVFIDVELPDEAGSGRYQAWEYYDYNLDPSYRDNRPPTAVWCRNGFVPPFAEETRVVLDNGVQRKQQPGVMRFVGRRYDKYDQLPQSMRELVEQSTSKEGIIDPAPGWDLFRAPPVDMEEIESLTSKEIKKRKQSKA